MLIIAVNFRIISRCTLNAGTLFEEDDSQPYGLGLRFFYKY
jgi:hypothetical protein